MNRGRLHGDRSGQNQPKKPGNGEGDIDGLPAEASGACHKQRLEMREEEQMI